MENRWIPVSEKAPEIKKEPYYVDFDEELYESERVLICFEDITKCIDYGVGQVIYEKYTDSYEWQVLDYREEYVDWQRILAWMPIPKYDRRKNG